MYSSAYVWAKVLSHMEERLGAVTVSAWFDDAEVVELNEDQLILYSPNDFRREIIIRRCTDYIQDALKEIFKIKLGIKIHGGDGFPLGAMGIQLLFTKDDQLGIGIEDLLQGILNIIGTALTDNIPTEV